MKRSVLFAGVMVLCASGHAFGQGTSWGITGSFVPLWNVPASLEILAAVHFSEDDIAISDQNLRGQEFRIGIARGRALSGDWGVSFVRRTFENGDFSSSFGGGCSGGGVGAALVLQCEDLSADLARRDVRLNGIEAHKFIPFVTIARRVQIGATFGGGVGFMSGRVNTTSSRTTYTCTFPPGVVPSFGNAEPGPENQCAGARITNLRTIPTGSTEGDVSRLLTSDSTMLPLGKVEIAAAVLAGPHFKIRVGGGLNYPGLSRFSVSGVYFFGR